MQNQVHVLTGYRWRKQARTAYADLVLDIAQTKKPILPGVDVALHLHRAEPSFYLLAGSDVNENVRRGLRVQITAINLLVRQRHMTTDGWQDLEKVMMRHGNKVNYDFKRVEVKKLSLAPNQLSWQSENIKAGSRVPERSLVMLVPEGRWAGDMSLNPFKSMCLRGNGYAVKDMYFTVDSIPLMPLSGSFDDDSYDFLRRAYLQLQTTFTGPGKHAMALTFREFANGAFMYLADFTRDGRTFDHRTWHRVKQGTLRLDIKFQQPPAEYLSVFIFNEYPTRVSIHKDRSVVYHYVNDV